jgi:hypothetical protein
MLALVWPVYLCAGWLSAAVAWPRGGATSICAVVALVCLGCALRPPAPAYYTYERQVCLPALAAVMARERCSVALGDYWCANMSTVFSDGAVRVLPLSATGHADYWFVNGNWFEQEPPGGYRLIVTQYGDVNRYRALYGEPERVESISDYQVLVYAPADALHFVPAFHTLGNRHCCPADNLLVARGAGIPFHTGRVENGVIVAREGRDLAGSIASGPNVMLGPGTYRVTYTYKILAPPQPSCCPALTLSIADTDGAEIHTSSVPDEEGVQQVAQNFTVPAGKRGWLEAWLEFHSSGVMEVDEQKVERLSD